MRWPLRRGRRARHAGISVSIDDFGTGYSSLRYLESFPLRKIKVDRSFVHDVANSAAKRVIAESVVKVGEVLGIRVVTEGIETEAEREIVQALGCAISAIANLIKLLCPEASLALPRHASRPARTLLGAARRALSRGRRIGSGRWCAPHEATMPDSVGPSSFGKNQQYRRVRVI
jgi:hypothetical protein